MTALILLRDFQASQIEFWLPTQYPGYDVSSFGRVRSWWHRQALGRLGSRSFLGDEPRILKILPASGGYRAVATARNKKGRPQTVSLHRLVAKAFLPEIVDLPHVNHKNCIKSDGRTDNLEWTKPKKNTEHGMRAGVIDTAGEANPMAKFTEADIRQMRTLRSLNVPRAEVAEIFHASVGYVWAVETGKRWSHIPLEKPFHF